MPAYVVANVTVTDREAYEQYRLQVPATIELYGGRYLVRGGLLERREGDWHPRRLVVLEFPSFDAARRWYESPEYRPLAELRQRAAQTDLVIVEGYES